ncbi:MAG: tetratricopeptide repeat protein, partial [Actinomycetota bacterium]
VAQAESPMGDRENNLKMGLSSLEQAERLFEKANKPMERSRTLNVIGSTLRELGRYPEAEQAFRAATSLVTKQINPGDYGGPMNNLGLVLMDLKRYPEAIESFEEALEAFKGHEFNRQRVDVLHNIGQAWSATEEPEKVARGVEYYRQALDITDPQEFPYQWALLHNSMGVAYTAIHEPEKAADSFRQALRVYTRGRWPFQYAVAKNNLGMAQIQIGGAEALRKAVAACEDSMLILDLRMHRQQWEQAYKNLQLAEKGLEELGESGTRSEHFARFLAGESRDELLGTLRERLFVYTTMPDPRRHQALTELDLAILALPDEQAQHVTNGWLAVLMEMPHEQFLAGLHGRMAAHETFDEEAKKRAVRILDYTIQNELLAPQRIRVRDTLYEIGYERPPSSEDDWEIDGQEA